ncbi:hypothetical protein Tco_1258892, partial [Tanacetum coccineum]
SLARGYAEHDGKRIYTYYIEVHDDVAAVRFMCTPEFMQNTMLMFQGLRKIWLPKHKCVLHFNVGRCSKAKVYAKYDGDGAGTCCIVNGAVDKVGRWCKAV